MPLTPQQRMNAISEQGLCAGCGLCQAVAGADKIQVQKSVNGFERPIIIGELSAELVDKIYDVCPGTHIEGLPQQQAVGTQTDLVWGPYMRMVEGWATDNRVRYEGSTGGVLTALALYLLASKEVDFILHVKASATEPSFGTACLSFTEVDVMQAVGSRYGPAAPLAIVDQVLQRNRPFAFIGKPCDIAALRNYARHDERVNRLVKYYLTMVCGGYMAPPAMRKVMANFNIDADHIKQLRYRGQGCPGATRIATTEQVTNLHYLDFWGDDVSSWQLPFRCKICPDGIGESADIAASDTWIGGSPNRLDSETDAGTNGIIVRTENGNRLLQEAIEADYITLGEAISVEQMSAYQPHQMRKKYNVYSRYRALADAGRIVPVTKRLRLAALNRQLSPTIQQQQRDGTTSRLQRGSVDEPTPQRAGR